MRGFRSILTKFLKFVRWLVACVLALIVILIVVFYVDFLVGPYALHKSASWGQKWAISLLLAMGEDINSAEPPRDHTPLHRAVTGIGDLAIGGHPEVVSMLLEKGAAVNATTLPYNQTSLHMVAIKGNEKIARSLLEAGADPLIASARREFAFSTAVSSCHLEVSMLLLEATERGLAGKGWREISKHNPSTFSALTHLGMLLDYSGKAELAPQVFARAATAAESLYGEEHYVTASAWENLGRTYARLGKYQFAKPHFLRALSIYEKLPPTAATATALLGMGVVHAFLGEHAKTEMALQRYLVISGEIESRSQTEQKARERGNQVSREEKTLLGEESASGRFALRLLAWLRQEQGASGLVFDELDSFKEEFLMTGEWMYRNLAHERENGGRWLGAGSCPWDFSSWLGASLGT